MRALWWVRIGARRWGRGRAAPPAWGHAALLALGALVVGAVAVWLPGPGLGPGGARPVVAAGPAAGRGDGRAWSLLALGVPAVAAHALARALSGHGFAQPTAVWDGRSGAAAAPAQASPPAKATPAGAVRAYPPSSPHPPNAVPPYPAPPPPDVYGSKPLVAIYHTDSMEAYLPAAGAAPAGGQAFSRDQAVGVVQVGAVLAQALYGLGVDSVHSRAVNDPDGMIGAYENSARTASALLAAYPGVRILLDLHRASSGESAAAAAGGAAAVALVVGTDDRLPDPHWRRNLAFAHVLAAAAARLYPDWPVRVEVSANQYNQELSPGALLVQVGGPATSLGSADVAARRLARVIAAVVASGLYPRAGG